MCTYTRLRKRRRRLRHKLRQRFLFTFRKSETIPVTITSDVIIPAIQHRKDVSVEA
ncbi:hypothetical protein HanRHA438_Chr11g0487841 [Helianthus annuus]|nr:hypothetical protein HanRHA438_Chr11g0487841 [Helianthus annuus]